MTKLLIKGAVIGGIILFAWGMVSWMVLPWHNMTLQRFSDEDTVAAVISANAPDDGVYIYPGEVDISGMSAEGKKAAGEAMLQKMKAGPFIFATFKKAGAESMIRPLVRGVLINVLSALVLSILILMSTIESYWGRVRLVVIFALGAGFLILLPYWNWWNISAGYTVVSLLDLVIGCFFAGLALAKVLR